MTKNKENAPVKSGRKAVFFRLMKYYLRYKWSVAAALLLMVGSNLFALLGPWLSGKALDAIAAEGGVDFAAVANFCLYMAIFYVASAIFSYLLTVVMTLLSQRIIRSMRQDVFDKILVLPLYLLDRMQAGDLINRISYDIDTVNASLSNDILQAATSVITVAGALIGMIAVSPILLGAFIITLPICILTLIFGISFYIENSNNQIFSEETQEWLKWYESLSYKEQKAISYMTKELIDAMKNGYKYKLDE